MRSALCFGGGDIHSSAAALIRSDKIDGTVVLQALGYTSAILKPRSAHVQHTINVQHTHTHSIMQISMNKH